MKALVVEEDQSLRELLVFVLERAGYEVVTAHDGPRALGCWSAEQPDIVLLDAGLPGISRVEVCRRLRRQSRTPVIMLTTRVEDLAGSGDAGADACVLKPFSPQALVAWMHAVLQARAAFP